MTEMDFDWVTARANCSSREVLGIMESQAQSDVKKRNDLLSPVEMRYGVEFVIKRGANVFVVSAVQNLGGPICKGNAMFTASDDGIKVAYSEMAHDDLLGSLTLDNEGACRLRVKGLSDPLTFWQFRKLALEPVLFDCTSGLRL